MGKYVSGRGSVLAASKAGTKLTGGHEKVNVVGTDVVLSHANDLKIAEKNGKIEDHER
jgi:hypothetical protein